MSDIYKLQYNGMTLSHPDWIGYVGYEAPVITNLDFGFSGLNNNVLGYMQYTMPDLSTGELTLGTGNEGQSLITSLPYGTEFSGYISANPYYRTTLNGGDTEPFVISKSTAEPRKVSFSGQLTSNNWIGSQNTQINSVTWHWNFNNNNSPSWRDNNGGACQVTMTPASNRMVVDSCYNNESAYCIKIITDGYSGSWYGATSKSTGSRTNAYIPTNRIGSIDSNTWSSVWFSAHVNMTAGYYHSNNTWNGEGNHGQRALNGAYLINSTQLATRGTDINSTFYKGSKNSTLTTSFNLTGTGNNMPATNWNNQAIRIYAQLGAFGGSINSDASKYPPNQVNSIYCTANCSAIFP